MQRLCWFWSELADRPAMSGGPSATRPRLTGEFAAGDSGHGLGWGNPRGSWESREFTLVTKSHMH